MLGKGIDPQTNINLETIETAKGCNGKMEYMLMELYNNSTREIADITNVPLIDLSNELPVNSSYFYDKDHFSVYGAKIAASIISNKLIDIINTRQTLHLTPFLK
jgi:hypothetical protein